MSMSALPLVAAIIGIRVYAFFDEHLKEHFYNGSINHITKRYIQYNVRNVQVRKYLRTEGDTIVLA